MCPETYTQPQWVGRRVNHTAQPTAATRQPTNHAPRVFALAIGDWHGWNFGPAIIAFVAELFNLIISLSWLSSVNTYSPPQL